MAVFPLRKFILKMSDYVRNYMANGNATNVNTLTQAMNLKSLMG